MMSIALFVSDKASLPPQSQPTTQDDTAFGHYEDGFHLGVFWTHISEPSRQPSVPGSRFLMTFTLHLGRVWPVLSAILQG